METVTLSKEFMDDFYEKHPEFKDLEQPDWCGCAEFCETPRYYEEGTHDGCVVKHHYHCSVCGKINQIG